MCHINPEHPRALAAFCVLKEIMKENTAKKPQAGYSHNRRKKDSFEKK
jgi:hypothetical protein